MTLQAQNAFLLTLEEPPPFVLFLLLTEDAGALLETVRSRAPVFRMQPIDHDTMYRYLETAPEALSGGAAALRRERPEELEALIALSGGAIGEALLLLDAKRRAPQMERRANASTLLELLAEHASQDRLLLTVLGFGEARDRVSAELSMLQLALRDLVLLSRTENAPLIFFTNREQATDLAACFTTARLLAILSAVEEARTALAANANVKLTLTHLLSKLFTV